MFRISGPGVHDGPDWPFRITGIRIEIALPDGTCIRVGADVGVAALRRVMTAVRR